MRKALSVERKMAVALWRLATVGYTWRSTALQFDVGRATVLRAKQELSNKLVRFQFFFCVGCSQCLWKLLFNYFVDSNIVV